MGPVQAQAEPNRDAGGDVVPTRPTLAKITMPSVAQSLPREALFSRLDEQSNRLIWLTAPAGYGKTTSVSTYLRARGRPAVWYQCDDGDADIASFFHYLSLTLEPSAGGRLSLPSFRPEYRDAVAAFTRNYFRAWFASLEVGTTVVLDDWHEIPAQAALVEMLPLIADQIPEEIRLIVISRHAPPAALTRFALSERMTLMGPDDLKYSKAETFALAH